ncbi:MAG: flagellar basal-body MS-ring/collar protein FliF [Hyphomonadaceae bacterium]
MADIKPDDPKGLIGQLARSGRMRIAAALVIVALVGGGLGVIMLQGGEGGKKLLFSGLDLEEAAEISGKLDTAGVAYTLEGGGSAIFVDATKVEDARMMLSEQGLPTRGSVGWEIFDKSDALGETQFVLNIKKLRAMEGELERSISAYDMVQSAKVHLSIPDKPLFQQNSDKPKAAVVLKLSGNMMPAEKVRAIRNLIASQVPGLSVEAVTVTSTDGRLLAAASDASGSTVGGGTNADERRFSMEESYRKKVLDVIENIAGPGAAKVTVSIDADFNRVTQSSETIDPESRTAESTTTVTESTSSQDVAPGDETTVANNVPTGADPAAPAQPTSQNQSSRSEETVNYLMNKTVRTEVIEGGAIKRLSVAVALDQVRVPGAEDAPATWQDRSPEEIARITALVKSAVLFNEQRGDVVTVESTAFARPDTSMDGATAPGPFDLDSFDLVRIGEILALALTALALVFFVLRPLISGLFTKPAPDNLPPEIQALKGAKRAKAIAAHQAMLAQQRSGDGAMANYQNNGPPQGNTVNFELSTPDRLDAGIDVSRISGQVKASSIKKISEVVAGHPDESVAIIRSWLAEEPSDRAA